MFVYWYYDKNYDYVSTTNNAILYVPIGTKDKYEAKAGWNMLVCKEIDLPDGTKERPFNVEEALVIANDLKYHNSTTPIYCIKGKVSEVKDAFDAQSGTTTLYIVNDDSSENKLMVNGAYYLENRPWEEGDFHIKPGDEVVVCGKITKTLFGTYDYEMVDNYIYSINGDNGILKDGDTFVRKTSEGVEMTFKVVSASERTCEVRGNAISTSTNGIITIPKRANAYDIITIGGSAFANCTGLTNVSIPNGIISIGDAAFFGCTGLNSISIPSIVLSIGNYAFAGCTGLTSIEIPNSVQEMWTNSFSGCNNIKTVSLDGIWKCSYSDDWSFGSFYDPSYSSVFGTQVESYILGNHLHKIQSKAFNDCTNLKEITIPNSVKTIEEGAFSGCNNLTTLNLDCDSIGPVFNGMSSIQTINFGDNIKKIGDNAFAGCTGLKSCIIPDNVTQVGIHVFSGCTSLSSVVLSKKMTTLDDYLFSDCSSLSHIEIPDNISSIGFQAFYNSGLQSIIIPNSVTSIENCAFEDCKRLSDVTISNSVQTIGHYAFSGCENLQSIIMPKGIKKITVGMFMNCNSLTNITVPDYVETIGESAFENCKKLSSINIPKRLNLIETNAFSGCDNLNKVIVPDIASWCNIDFKNSGSFLMPNISNPLNITHHLYSDEATEITDLVIPEGVENVNNYAFYGGSNLKSVTIPSSLKNIGTGAFNGCEALSKVIVPDIASWCNINFADNPLLNAKHFYSDAETEITDLSIPYGVKKINNGAFNNAISINSINLPNSVTEIGSNAFYGCSSLKSLTLPNGIEKIGSNAFNYCSSLEKLVIPNSVKSIDSYAFGNCLNLYSVTSLINIPFKLNESAFSYSGTDYSTDVIYMAATLYVPRGKMAMYMLTEGWQKFINVIETDTKFRLTYVLDGEEYKVYEIQAAEIITPEPDPFKEGYDFSGWSEIPYIMPAQDVTITGSFTPGVGVTDVQTNDATSKEYYTIDGRRTHKMQRGINILRMSDGSVRKVLVK